MNESPKTLWPYAIITVLVLFAGGVVTIAVLAQGHKPELVSRDYYAKELVHQQQIEREARALALETKPKISLDAKGVRIAFGILGPDVERGEVECYRPSNGDMDFTLPLELDDAFTQRLPREKLAPGLWMVNLTWSAGGEDYFCRQRLFVP